MIWVENALPSATSDAPVLRVGAMSTMPGMAASRIASASSKVRVGVVALTSTKRPPVCAWTPGLMKSRLDPVPRMFDSIDACAPAPRDINAITAATPITMPSTVKLVRSLLAVSARKARRTPSARLMR